MVNASAALDRSFGALAHPIRRGIVERLAHGPATVRVATGGLGVSKPAISRHLRVLEEAGLVVRTIEGRTHRLALERAALADASAWMARQRELWERMFDAVEEHLR
jgi:DNA-binding transcriptional ArsR family regulator